MLYYKAKYVETVLLNCKHTLTQKVLQANRIEWRHGYGLLSAEMSVVMDQSWRKWKYGDKIDINADNLQW